MASGRPRLVKTIAVFAVAALVLAVLVAGCQDTPEEAEAPPVDINAPDADGAAEPQQPEDEAAEDEDAAAAEQEETVADATGEEAANMNTIVKIKTGKGDMIAELYDEKMPITAGNFLTLIDDGFYDNLTFHRVVPEFVIQGGDPDGNGSGGPGWAIPLEKPGEVHHETGILSMARAQPLDSAGSQFFVCLSDNQSVQSLDNLGGGYAAFGKVTEGMDVAQNISVGDALEGIEIVSESPHADAAREAAVSARLPSPR